MSMLSSYSTVIPYRLEWVSLFCFVFLFVLFLFYDVCKLLTESPCGNSKAIQNVCERSLKMKKQKMAALSGLSCHWGGMSWREKKKRECPVQKSSLG